MGTKSIYVNEKDEQILNENLPVDRTGNQFMTDIIHEKAESFRKQKGDQS